MIGPLLLAAAAVVAVPPFEIEGAGPAHARRMASLYAGGLDEAGCADGVDLSQFGPALVDEIAHCYGRSKCIGTLARTFARADTLLLGTVSRVAGVLVLEVRVLDAATAVPVGRVVQPLGKGLDTMVPATAAVVPKLCQVLARPRDGDELELTLPELAGRNELALTIPAAPVSPAPPEPFVEDLPPPPPPPPPEPVVLVLDPGAALVDAVDSARAPVPLATPAPTPVVRRAPPAPAPPPKRPPLPPVAVDPPRAPISNGTVALVLGIGAAAAGVVALGTGLGARGARQDDAVVEVAGAQAHRISRADAVFSNQLAFATNLSLVVGALLGGGAGYFYLKGNSAPEGGK